MDTTDKESATVVSADAPPSAPGPRTSLRYNAISATFAFVTWGTWAWYVNRDSLRTSPVVSGLAQGTGSLVMTLLLVKVVTFLYAKLPATAIRPWACGVLAASFAAVLLYSVHAVVGTANIVLTIAPGLTVAVTFSTVTAFQLQRQLTT